jgi:hypothetical protein
MDNHKEVIQPAIMALVELGNGVGGIRISASDRAATRKHLNDAFEASKARSQVAKIDSQP